MDVKVARKGHRSRDVSRERKRYTSPSTIPSEHTYSDILEPEEPTNKREILVPIASTPMINRPLAAADVNSKGGNSRGGSDAGQLRHFAGCRDESEDEDDEDPPAVIDKSEKSSFTRKSAGLSANIVKASEEPAGSHQRGRTDHRNRRSGRMEIESVEADCPVQAEALDSEWDHVHYLVG